jgi:hypothetical protein
MDLLSSGDTLKEGTGAGDNESLHFAKSRVSYHETKLIR